MPTVMRSGPYRFYFYSHDPNEPPHIHVGREEMSAKFWLDPIQLARNFWISRTRTPHATTDVEEHKQEFLEAWDEFFGIGGR